MKGSFLCVVWIFGALATQAQAKVVADKISGIVGDKIILKSEISLANEDIKRQGGQALDDCSVLDQMLTQKALVLQAEKDSLPVSDEEVEAEIDQRIRYFISQYGSKDALEQISGRSVYQIKEDFRQPIREQRLATAMKNKIVENIKITPTEVKESYEKIPEANRLFYESQVQIGEIVVYPKASRDVELLAIDELNDYKRQVEAGTKKFETLAALYSDDPGSKDHGGVYQINRADKQWDPVWFSTAWRLKEGQISSVIKSKFGYHIIQMVSRSGDDAVVRHILRIPQITQTENEEAITKLDSVRQKLVAGSLSFGEAVARYSDDETAKFTAGRLLGHDGSSYLLLTDLDKDLILMLKNKTLKPGDYSPPMPFTDERGKKGVRLVYLITQSEPHRENLKDDYNKIAQRALDEKKSNVLQKWFAERIATYYIMIDEEYRSCPILTKWQKPGANVTAAVEK